MTRRRIMMPCGIGFWITPEINGDHDELMTFGSSDSCDLTWSEIRALFMGAQDKAAFEQASVMAQRCFHSSIGATEPMPLTYHLSLDGLRCDELYRVQNGELQRIYNVNCLYVQIHYSGQESSIVDTAEFDCPPGVTKGELLDAIRAARKELPYQEDEDRLDYMDDVLTRAAIELHATWHYISISTCLEAE